MPNINSTTGLGTLQTFRIEEHQLQAETSNGKFQVSLYGDGIFRIHISFQEEFDQHSYAVVAIPSQELNVNEKSDALTITSGHYHLDIEKSPLRFTLKTSEGQIINEDEPGLGVSAIGDQITTYKKLQDGERFIGLGEKTGPLDRRGRGYVNWNTDNFGYHNEADPLYASVPFYIGIHNGQYYGIFLDNSYKSQFNFGASNNRFSSFSVDGGDLNYYLIAGHDVKSIISKYTHLTGRTPLPPKWSLGYQQCRYSYYPDKKVTTLAQQFRDKDIPGDVIVMDIHYMEAYKIFTWDKKRFPDPEGMIKDLKDKGFNIVVMCDPGIKVEKGYEAYESGLEENIFLTYPDGEPYTGMVWPGWCHFPDFTNEKAREWWGKRMKGYSDIGVKGYWNDMNEIATWGNMLPDNILFDFEGKGGTTRNGRNVFGFMMSKATFESTKKLLDGERPFNLTRSGFAGIQRYAAVWTGDNVANDDHMLLGVRIVNSMGLAGIAFAGYDIGGFTGDTSEHLFARWIQIGAFSPFFRGHTMINSRDAEPWAFGEEVEEISRNFIKLRYRLMPYIYSYFKEAEETGLPITRTLAINYPEDYKIYSGDYENEYLFGESILVVPCRSDRRLTKVYIPEGKWYNFYTDETVSGPQEIIVDCPIEQLPLYVKASAILPMNEKAGINVDDVNEVLELHIYNGTSKSSFELYEDDGKTYDYENDNYHRRRITYDAQENIIRLDQARGKFNPSYRIVKFVLHGFDELKSTLEDHSTQVNAHSYKFIEPISSFDPFGNDHTDKLIIENVQSFSLNYSSDDMEIKLV